MSSAVARAKVSRAIGPTTAFEPSAMVSSVTEAKPRVARPPLELARARSVVRSGGEITSTRRA